MKVPESAENYLEAILMLSLEQEVVRSVDIARKLGFTKASVSVAMKNLRENNMITMKSGHLKLTEKGKKVAEAVYERHMILAKMLIALGVSEDVAFEDACKMEHDISDESFEKIKEHYREQVR